MDYELRPRYAHVDPGLIETLTEPARAIYSGLVLEGRAQRVGPFIIAQDCLTTAALRARIFEPFLSDGWIVSHLSAAWVHWRVGVPFPVCLSSTKRVRATDETVRFQDARAPAHLDPTLDIPVTTPAYTVAQLLAQGFLDDRTPDSSPTISSFCSSSNDCPVLGSLRIPRQYGEGQPTSH